MITVSRFIKKAAHFLGTPSIGAMLTAITYITTNPDTAITNSFSIALFSILMNLLTQNKYKLSYRPAR